LALENASSQPLRYADPYDPWGFRQRHLIRSRTLKISTELFEDILQGNAGMWLLLLLSEYNCQQVCMRSASIAEAVRDIAYSV
jgi:hypothetical protein